MNKIFGRYPGSDSLEDLVDLPFGHGLHRGEEFLQAVMPPFQVVMFPLQRCDAGFERVGIVLALDALGYARGALWSVGRTLAKRGLVSVCYGLPRRGSAVTRPTLTFRFLQASHATKTLRLLCCSPKDGVCDGSPDAAWILLSGVASGLDEAISLDWYLKAGRISRYR